MRYQHFKPSKKLVDVIDSFWIHHNPDDQTESISIAPDSFFKILIYVQDGKVINYFLTGIWTEPKMIDIPPKTHTIGCRFNVLAPEYLFQNEVASILNTSKQLDRAFLNIDTYTLSNLDRVIEQWQKELLKIRGNREIASHKLRLAQAIYSTKGSLTASELSDQIFMTNRTINRYLNKYLGISLQTYISIQRSFQAYLNIREGNFSPTKDFYDQSHYIREIKKHTGASPRKIFKGINDRFIQFRHIHTK